MSTGQRMIRFGVIISLLLLFVVVGCSNSDTSSQQSTNEEREDSEKIENVRVFKSHLSKGVLPGSDDPHVQQVLEETGVEYELMTPPAGSDATEYLNMLFASEDYPDIFRPIGGMERTLIQQGAALPLDDLLPEYAPHVWNSIPEEAWDVVRAATPDGKIYYVPKVYTIPERAALLRQDWLNNVGLEMPETLEEYREMLIAFRDQDPNGNGEQDELPTSGREFGTWMDHLFAMFGVAMWEGHPEWDIYDGEIQYAGVTENMKEAIIFIRELYEEELLDKETFLNKGDVWTAKINNNLVGSWYHLPANLLDRYEAMRQGAEDAYVVGMPLPKVDGFTGFITQKSMGEPEWMIPKVSEDKAIASLKLLDFFYDQENDDFIRYGIEGAQHKVEDGKKVLIAATDETPIALGMRNLMTKEDMDIRINETFPEDQQQMVMDIFEVSTADARRIAGDGLPSTVYDGYSDIQSHKLFQEYLTKIVIGEWPIDRFDEFVERWYSSGGDEVTERVQEWYERLN
ncbi:extracellular solute-binding protein [Halalkalibacter sp. APA_J-10(15)]|uniref:extracellular solute-binding protein n=1 Tax=Halalkalibacter sp. APA_J-10(15) TaxID=2933805 RepID=UPI001FF13E8A|nr:extracellular solute-binding protein [Halalkalibacter sp. APA_J-10(15)]MCK0473683.1 extracellular solute-binding protein [Halalkalibacter sp. APA_J-10(15)]